MHVIDDRAATYVEPAAQSQTKNKAEIVDLLLRRGLSRWAERMAFPYLPRPKSETSMTRLPSRRILLISVFAVITAAGAQADNGDRGLAPSTGGGASDSAQDETDSLTLIARKAYRLCAAKGYAVTVSLVSTAGLPLVIIHNETASIVTIEGSFAKAYTIMALGPGKHVDTNSALAAIYRSASSASYRLPEAAQPHISFTPGSVLVRRNGRLIGGLGVSGSPTGEIDEACAKDAIKGLD